MRQTFVAMLMLTAPVAISAQSAAPAVDSKTQTQDIHFKNERYDRMTVPVRLSGAGPFRFLVDTGADRTAISRELAGRLGLAGGEAASLHTVAGVSTVSTALIPDLQLTRRPLRTIDAPLLDSENMGADGIIGVDALRSQSVLFDFDKDLLSIVPSASSDFHDEPNVIVVQAVRRNGRLVFTDAVANGHSLTVVIDTGAQISIGNQALKDELVGRGLVDPAQKVQLQSVTGDFISGDYMFVRELEIGGVALKNLAIVFADAHTFKELKLEDRPALLLGMNAIRAFKKVSIDFANRKFRVVLPESSELDVRLASAALR
ncbi:MAG TPA: retroviral-like aspartic protease family protein [Sphingomicrobium sp.]|nr:retroviral-like aspartic protease family protein [Sphingomicrobium sp.]